MNGIMKEGCVVDTTAIVKVILEKDEKLVKELIEKYKLYIPINAAEETAFQIIMKSLSEKYKTTKFYEIKDKFRKEDKNEIIEKRLTALNMFLDNFIALPITIDIFEISKELIKKYNLLSNDALIAAVCKYYGIKKLASFDDNFENLDFLEIVRS